MRLLFLLAAFGAVASALPILGRQVSVLCALQDDSYILESNMSIGPERPMHRTSTLVEHYLNNQQN